MVLHAYLEWGTECFSRFNGMWALAILDLRGDGRPCSRATTSGSSRSTGRGRAAAGSSSRRRPRRCSPIPSWRVAPDAQWLYDYLLHGLHDHQPQTAFAGVRSLAAATWAVVDDAGVHEQVYWEPALATDAANDPAEFRARFERSVERRLVADVPAGTCLSGGIDSSSIVTVSNRLLAAHVPDAVSLGDHLKTFSIVYDGDPIDEREYMDAVLAEVDAEPSFAEPTSAEFLRELDRVVWHQDEPIVSTGPYAQWCVMRLAQPQVTVLLNGQGGDELLAGYVPYQYVYLRELLQRRRLGAFAAEAWEARDVLLPLVRRRLSDRRRSLPIAPLLRAEFTAGLDPPRHQRSQTRLKERLVADLQTFSLPSLLRYEDRNSMAFSMESRLPFLDQELVDWVLRLPPEALVDRGWSRAILRDGPPGRAHREGAHPTLEGRVHDARDALAARPSRRVPGSLPVTAVLRTALLGRDGARRRVRPVLRRRGRAVADLLARRSTPRSGSACSSRPTARSRLGAAPERHFTAIGDEWMARALGRRTRHVARPVRGRTPACHLFARSPVDGRDHARVPVRTRLFVAGDSLADGLTEALADVDARDRPTWSR